MSRRATVELFEWFMDLSVNSERRFELIHGQIVEINTNYKRPYIIPNVGAPIHEYLRAHKTGHVGASVHHRAPGKPYDCRLIDVSVWSLEELTDEWGAGATMPMLAIDIQTPDETRRAMRRKAEWLLVNGARMVWLIYTLREQVEVMTSTERRLLSKQDTLDGGDVLPGFSMPVSEVFS
jgi:Uma2 family endonuclease